MPRSLLYLCAVLLASGCAVSEETAEETGEGSDCFYQSQLRSYKVVDDQHIVVSATGNRAYLIELWRPVHNLDRRFRIGFESPRDRVCSVISKVRVDGGISIRSIRQIPEAERDALRSQGENVEYAPVDGADIEDLTGEDPAPEQEEDQQ